MVKKTFNPAEYRLKQEKKLNQGRKPGFIFDVCLYDDTLTNVVKNANTACVLDYLGGKQYLGAMYPSQPCSYIVCNTLLFKLLNLPTMWAYEPLTGMYIYYLAPADEAILTGFKALKTRIL